MLLTNIAEMKINIYSMILSCYFVVYYIDNLTCQHFYFVLPFNRFMMAMRNPKEMNAPGGSTKSRILVLSGSNVVPKQEPAPNISRTAPSNVSAIAKPIPIPIPSKILAIGEFLQANASARPRMIQFTTIKGMKIPKLLSISGK